MQSCRHEAVNTKNAADELDVELNVADAYRSMATTDIRGLHWQPQLRERNLIGLASYIWDFVYQEMPCRRS